MKSPTGPHFPKSMHTSHLGPYKTSNLTVVGTVAFNNELTSLSDTFNDLLSQDYQETDENTNTTMGTVSIGLRGSAMVKSSIFSISHTFLADCIFEANRTNWKQQFLDGKRTVKWNVFSQTCTFGVRVFPHLSA